MKLYGNENSEIRAILVDKGASFYKIKVADQICRVPIHLVHNILREPDGWHRISVSTWFLRRMGILPRSEIEVF